ncbi:MAG: hypothetical protein ABI663_05825 [Chryseolinea sp.]
MTFKQFDFIAQIQIGFYIVATVFSFVRFHHREAYIKLIGLYCAASAVADLSSLLFYFLKLNHVVSINVNYAASVFHILALPLLSMVYYITLGKSQKKQLVSITVIYSLVGITNLLFIQKETINSYTLILQSIIIIGYCVYYFYWLIKELPTMYLHRLPMFWINSAFMVFYSGNLFLFVFTSYLVHVLNNNLLVYWSLHNFLGMIKFSMIIFALWTDLQNIKSHSL